MKRICELLPLLMAFALTGCGESESQQAGNEGVSLSLFKAGKGVVFSDETKKLFGLEIADVAEKPMQQRSERTAQVYRTGIGGGRSSALLLLDADEAATLAPGKPMQVRAAKGGTRELPGKLVRFDRQATAALGLVEGVVEFADLHQEFAAGEFVFVAFTTGDPKPVLVVPQSAVLLTADGKYVYAVNGTHLTRTRVKTGSSSDGLVEVQDGLYAGDSVVVKGVQNIWLVELSALKGGTPCCPVPKKS